MRSDYWLSDLLDEHRIESLAAAASLFENDRRLVDVLEPYQGSRAPLDALPPHRGETIVAGSVLDLSGSLDCSHPACIMGRVDDLFGRVWHYFDSVVVTGAESRGVAESAKRDPDDLREYLLAHVETLLYLREIGAEDLLVFREKPHWCMKHLPQNAVRLGVPRFEEMREQFIDLALKSDLLDRPPVYEGGMWRCLVRRPWGGFVFLNVDLPQDASLEEIERAAAEREFHGIADLFAGDVLRADAYDAPLAVMNDVHETWLQGREQMPDPNQVALSLTLPVLQDVSPRDIVQIRKEEANSFEIFRTAVRQAIRERVANSAEGETSEQIAREISQDILGPAVHDIERSLRTARATVLKKSAARIGLATTSVTAGLLTGVPGMVATGLGLAFGATALPPVDSYVDQRREIELRDMYFLWKADQLAPRT